MRATLQPILDLLDDGLRIYRRAFVRFALLAALGAVPAVAVAILSLSIANETARVLVTLALLLLGLPLAVYVVGAISRATLMAQSGEPISLQAALAIGPLRLLGMGCYGGIFLFVANLVVSMVSMLCFCPVYFFLIFAVVGASGSIGGFGAVGEALAGLFVAVIGIAALCFYGLALVLSGATYGSLVYSIQPFVQGQLRLGAAMQRSIDMIFYRFGRNLLAFLCTSLVFGAVALSVTLAIGVLLPLPLLFLFGQESLFAQGISVSAWLVGLTLAAPPLPIWMALLYQRQLAEREGADLAERIGQLEGGTSSRMDAL